MSRIHWPSLIITLIAMALAIWIVLEMPAGPEAFCVSRGGEWFPEMRKCL